jgi:hypothetical protein
VVYTTSSSKQDNAEKFYTTKFNQKLAEDQGCQMRLFAYRKTNVGIFLFLKALECKMFGIFYCHLVYFCGHWVYIFPVWYVVP